MAPVNWLRLFQQHGVEFIERGANVKRGNVNIHCPFCGSADPSHHMGIDLTTGWWGCWRHQDHRGKSPLRLLVKLLGVSYFKAREIAGLDNDYVDPEGFDSMAARIMGREKLTKVEEVHREFLQFPREFRELEFKGAARRFCEYLVGRGFYEPTHLANLYQLRAAIDGRFKDRLILPYVVGGDIVSWTGRDITGTAMIRYKDLSLDESLVPGKETLFNHDACLDGGEALIVVEGPMDVLKLDYYGRDWGIRAVGLSTASLQEEQIYILEEAGPRFNQVLVMMDNASQLGFVDSMRMKDKLSQIKNLGFAKVPNSRKDAGELSPSQVVTFCRGIL